MKRITKILSVATILLIILSMSVLLHKMTIDSKKVKIGGYFYNEHTKIVLTLPNIYDIPRCFIIPENVKITFENGSDIPQDNCVHEGDKLNISWVKV